MVQVVKDLSHPNIVQYFGFHDDGKHCFIVMERCKCSLNDGLDQLPDVWEAARQLTCALESVHGFGYAHRYLPA